MITEYVQKNTTMGELGHPQGRLLTWIECLTLSKISLRMVITSSGEQRFSETPMGKIVKKILWMRVGELNY